MTNNFLQKLWKNVHQYISSIQCVQKLLPNENVELWTKNYADMNKITFTKSLPKGTRRRRFSSHFFTHLQNALNKKV